MKQTKMGHPARPIQSLPRSGEVGEAGIDFKSILPEIPVSTLTDISQQLLTKWEQEKRITLLFPEQHLKEYPTAFFLGVLALDWAGLAEATAGAITDMDWNIETSWGTVFTYKEEKIAIMIYGISVKDFNQLQLYLNQEEELRNKLYKLCYKGWRKRLLITQGSKKVEKFEEVMELLKEWDKLTTDLAGAVTKFFNSREEQYLSERSAEHLASVILTDYEFVQEVKKSGGKPQIEVTHFTVGTEKVTGVTIVAFDRDFSLALALEAIKSIVLNYSIKYNKEYVTSDGIVVYRIEVMGHQPIKSLENVISNRIISKKFNALKTIESYGGFEHYAKAIIPQLIKEYTATKIPQIYLSPVFVSPEFVQFKLIIVKDHSPKESVNQYISTLEQHKTITIVAHGTPGIYRNLEINVFDLRVVKGTENTYAMIKESLSTILPKFRDFDEGLRKVDTQKLEAIKQKLRGTQRGYLREFYYAIEDFYRVSAPVAEIVKLIEIGTKLVKTPGIEIVKINENCLLVGIASKTKILAQALEILKDYKVVASKLQIEEFEISLLKVEKQLDPITEKEITYIEKALKTLSI
ncbi:MAG: hypothetical protein PHX21_01840 [bacterium]|nr:hypothetical protein [bacterium]